MKNQALTIILKTYKVKQDLFKGKRIKIFLFGTPVFFRSTIYQLHRNLHFIEY